MNQHKATAEGTVQGSAVWSQALSTPRCHVWGQRFTWSLRDQQLVPEGQELVNTADPSRKKAPDGAQITGGEQGAINIPK